MEGGHTMITIIQPEAVEGDSVLGRMAVQEVPVAPMAVQEHLL